MRVSLPRELFSLVNTSIDESKREGFLAGRRQMQAEAAEVCRKRSADLSGDEDALMCDLAAAALILAAEEIEKLTEAAQAEE